MSTVIRIALVMNLLPLLFLLALVSSDQSMVPLRSFKIGGNVTYDCVEIHKQSAFDHPLLKSHKIQMKPTVSRTEFKNHTSNDKISFKKRIGCPTGTVPILRNSKEFITNSQHFADKYLHPLSADSPGTHVAGVRSRNGPFHGVEAAFDGHNLNVRKDQASYKQIYIGSGLNNQVNYISAGLMINPGFFSDARVWTFGFWKVCMVKMEKDKNTGNWWLTQLNSHAPSVDIGYWPKELFNLFDNGASMAGVGGVVQASHSGLSHPMGNGNFPNGDRLHSSLFANIKALDSNYKQRKMNSFHIENLLDSPRCYGLKIGKVPIYLRNPLDFYFNYGGPGGNSCGV